MLSEELALRVHDVSKSYRLFGHPADRIRQFALLGLKKFHSEFVALNDVSFEVRKGETVGIIGRNGSGKSTLLQVIAGILKPSHGTVDVRGRIAALLELGAGFNPDFTGRENVYFQGTLMGLSRHEMSDRFSSIEEFAGIGCFIDEPLRVYSSGMAIRLAFAVAIHIDPDILIVDEALSVGDAAFQLRCLEWMRDRSAEGQTTLFVSHDIGTVRAFCDRVIYLSSGMVKASGAADVVTEIYLQDVRSEKASQHKTPDSSKMNISERRTKFHPAHQAKGKILNACFLPDENESLHVKGEQRVSIRIEVEVDRSIDAPQITILLQDGRLLLISGKTFPLDQANSLASACRFAGEYSFSTRLGAGEYFLTIRLENATKPSPTLLDKHLGKLSLLVTSLSPDDFLGAVDIGLTAGGSFTETTASRG